NRIRNSEGASPSLLRPRPRLPHRWIEAKQRARLRSPGDSQDVRIGRDVLRGTEGEAVTTLDVEARLLDHAAGIAAEVTTAGDSWPEGGIGKALQPRLEWAFRHHVLVE